MKIIWTRTASTDLDNLVDYISEDSPTYANVFAVEILNVVDQLRDFPRSGRVVPEYQQENVRESLVGNYRIIYEITASVLRILTIVHGTRLLR